jgi:hypothetical protein
MDRILNEENNIQKGLKQGDHLAFYHACSGWDLSGAQFVDNLETLKAILYVLN